MSFGKFIAVIIGLPFFSLGVVISWPFVAFYYGCVYSYREANR